MQSMSTLSVEAVNEELTTLRATHLQLQDTIANLRAELENAVVAGRANVQATEATFANRIAELH